MKTKIFAVLCSLIICLNIFVCFPMCASAAIPSGKLVYDQSLYEHVDFGIDVRGLTPSQAFYYYSSDTLSSVSSLIDDEGFSGSIIYYNDHSLTRYLFFNLTSLYYDPSDSSVSFNYTDVKVAFYTTSLNNYEFSFGSSQMLLTPVRSPLKFYFNGSNNYTLLYSDFDIYYKGSSDLYRPSDSVDPLATNDDWFDITCDPQLSEDMSFSTTYTDPKGNEQIAADYTLDVSISKTGDMFKDKDVERLLNNYTQCFMFISTEPVSERDYSAALNSCIYLHYENRQYYGNVVFDFDYTVKDDIELWTGKSLGNLADVQDRISSRNLGVTSYSLLTGYVPYAVFSGSQDAHYTVDLNGVPLEVGQTYYINVLAFGMSSTFLRNSDISSSYPMSSLIFRSAVDDSLTESGNFSPQQLLQEAEDLSGVFVVGKSAAFSLNNLNGYKFVDKSSEFGVDPYSYSDDKLHADKYQDTITDRTDYTKRGNGFTTDTPSPDFVQKSLFGFNSSGSGSFNGILSSLKSVVPFYSQVVDCLPDNIQPVLLLIIVFPLICILIGVIIGGIKWLISLFTG